MVGNGSGQCIYPFNGSISYAEYLITCHYGVNCSHPWTDCPVVCQRGTYTPEQRPLFPPVYFGGDPDRINWRICFWCKCLFAGHYHTQRIRCFFGLQDNQVQIKCPKNTGYGSGSSRPDCFGVLPVLFSIHWDDLVPYCYLQHGRCLAVCHIL